MTLLLRGLRLGPGGPTGDVLVADGVVREIGPSVGVPAGTEVLTGADLTLLPGLVDAHVHLTQWALSRQRVDVSSAASPEEVCRLVAAAADGYLADELITAYGFRDAGWERRPDGADLERALPGRKVLAVSNDLHTAWLSPAAAALVGGIPADGVVLEGRALEVVVALSDAGTADRLVHEELALAAARGVTAIWDFEAADNLADWSRRADGRALATRIVATVYPEHLDAALDAGLRAGDPVPGTAGRVAVGPVKVFVDGSLNTRTAWCRAPYVGGDPADVGVVTTDLPTLVALLERAHRGGLEAAVHAIGDRAIGTALDAFERVGVPGRIEHAQLMSPADIQQMAALDLVAGIQPVHALDDQHVAERLWGDRLPQAFPHGSLHRGGVRVEIGSDAPVSPLDPWLGVAAATWRTLDDTDPWQPEQTMPLADALTAACGGRRTVTEGQPADLVVVHGDPAEMAPAEVARIEVAGTLLAGEWTWRDPTH